MHDYVEMNINLFTEKGLIDFCDFSWSPINISPIPKFNFLEFSNDHNKNREVLDFDLSRFCEMEIVKNRWNDINNMANSDGLVRKIKSLFEKCFVVQKVVYDDVGYFIFKVYLIANSKGRILYI